MAKIVEEVEIARSAADVYRALVVEAIGQNAGAYLFAGVLGQLSFEVLTPGELRVGSQIREAIRTLGGHEEVLMVTVTELVPAAKFASKLAASRRLKKLDKTFLFDPMPGGTRVTMTLDYGIAGIFARGLEVMIANRAVHTVWRTALNRLKFGLEAAVR